MKKSFADILQGMDSDRNRKIARKLPDWADDPSLEYPSSLALEQCSSSATASYKAGIALSLAGSDALLTDITGGLGVDSLAFSRVLGKVCYNEQNTELAQAAERNFKRLNANNIEVFNRTVDTGTALPESGIIYADPARRSSEGRKVFMLEDCTPDVLTLLPGMLEKAPHVMIKLSPMADISLLQRKFAGHLRHLHIVSLSGEVKELLCLLDRSVSEEYDLTVADAATGESFTFTPQDEENAAAVFARQMLPGQTLIEPQAAILKSGAFKLLCSRWGLEKIAPSTHLYLASDETATVIPLVKRFTVQEVFPFDKASLRRLKAICPKAEVSARNIPLSSDALRQKLGIAPGGNAHIFGCGTSDRKNILILSVPAGCESRKCGR